MSIGRALKKRAKAAIPPAVFLLLTAYFLWSATQGERGLQAYEARQKDYAIAKDELGRAEAERAAWERRVLALRNNRLDVDALDERARAMLNLSDPADVIVQYPPGKKLF